MDSSDSPPRSSSKFLMRMERSATGRWTDMGTPSEVVMLMSLGLDEVFSAIITDLLSGDVWLRKWGKLSMS